MYVHLLVCSPLSVYRPSASRNLGLDGSWRSHRVGQRAICNWRITTNAHFTRSQECKVASPTVVSAEEHYTRDCIKKEFHKKGLNCVVQVRGRNHSCREPGEYTLLDSEASPPSFFDLLRPGMSPIGGGGGGRGIDPPTPPPSFLLGAAGITAADAATFSTLSHFLSFPEKCVEVRCSSVIQRRKETYAERPWCWIAELCRIKLVRHLCRL